MKKVRPFSCGSQYADWQESNCERCKKREAADMVSTSCDIDADLTGAYIGDGEVSEDIAKRMGLLDNQNEYNWMCPEVDWTDEWEAECKAMRNREQEGKPNGLG